MAVFEYQVPKATFSLRNKSSRKLKGGERTLYIKVGIDGGYVMKSTGIWLKPNQWDPAEQMVINSRDAKELNEMLRSLKTKIDRLILTKYGELATANDIRQLLNSSDPERKTHVDFYNYAHEVNQSNYDRGKYGYKSWYSKKRNILMFQKFVQEQLCMTSLTFEDLSVSIFDKYIAYRFNELKNTSREGINKTLVPLYEAIKYAVKKWYL